MEATKEPQKGEPQPGGSPAKKIDKAASGKGEAQQDAPGRPARPTRQGRTSTRTHARDPGVASSHPRGEVTASTQNSPGAPAESPVERRTVRETGRVSDRVHTRKPSQPTQPKTDARGTRQGQPHRWAPKRVKRGASPAPLPRREPEAGTMSPLPGRPPRAPRSHPVKPGAQTPGVGNGTMASRKPTGAPRGTGPDEEQRTTRGHQARQRGTPLATTKAQGQVPSNNGHRVPQTRAASTTRNEPRHQNRCQATPDPHTTNASQEWQGTSRARTQAHTHPGTPARSGGAQPKPEPKRTHPHRTSQPGVAGYKRSAHTNTHKPQHPNQEWRRGAQTRVGANTPTAHTPARGGGAQAERAHKHAHPNTRARSGGAQPKPEPKHAQPSQEWRGTSGARTQTRTPQQPSQERRGPAETRAQAHTPPPHGPARSGRVQAERAHKHTQNPNTPARSGGAQQKAEPKHTHPHRTPQPGMGGYKRSAHTSTHTLKHPSQEWRGAAETRSQAHTPTSHTPARSGGVQAERAHKHAHPNTPARRGGAQPKPEPKHTRPHHTPQPGVAGYKRSAHTSTQRTPTPQPGVAGRSQNRTPSTNTHTAHPSPEWGGTSGARTQTRTPQHPSQERRGPAKTRAQAHTPTPHTPARSGRVQAERAHKHTQNPNTPARSGGAQPKPEP